MIGHYLLSISVTAPDSGLKRPFRYTKNSVRRDNQGCSLKLDESSLSLRTSRDD